MAWHHVFGERTGVGNAKVSLGIDGRVRRKFFGQHGIGDNTTPVEQDGDLDLQFSQPSFDISQHGVIANPNDSKTGEFVVPGDGSFVEGLEFGFGSRISWQNVQQDKRTRANHLGEVIDSLTKGTTFAVLYIGERKCGKAEVGGRCGESVVLGQGERLCLCDGGETQQE